MNTPTLQRWAVAIAVTWVIVAAVASRSCCGAEARVDTLTFIYAEMDTIIIPHLNVEPWTKQVITDTTRYHYLALKRGRLIVSETTWYTWEWARLPERPKWVVLVGDGDGDAEEE